MISRGDRHLGYSSRHTQVPVPATTPALRGSHHKCGPFCFRTERQGEEVPDPSAPCRCDTVTL